ncbi:MAG TPA: 30S ribosome-binding factor RbfA [Chitinispirillaceae bacterium]|nr:30S ribosome-binding factor RbfA [Chitinispirillaceae bacterium]
MSSTHFHIERLSELLQREIGVVISRELRDPRIPPVVTITQVKLAQDTRNATVFVSILGEPNVKSDAIAALNKAASFIQRIVASRITVKHFPRLYFKIDNSIEHSQHINELLKEIQDDLE